MAILSQIKRNVLEKMTFKVAIISLLTIAIFCAAGPCFGQQTETATYTYDKLNRLTGVIYSTGPAIIYTYDAAGNRIAVQVISTGSIPVITTLNPGSAVAGGQGFTLILNGAHFTNNSTVQWGGANRSTTFVNDSILTASISASDIATPVPVNVSVVNPSSGGTSNAVNFTIASTSALRIDGVSQRAGRTSGGQQIRLTGAFANLSAVTLGGVSATWGYSNGTSEITVTTPPNNVGAVTIDLTPTSGNAYFKSNAFAFLPTTFTDDTLVAGVTTARAQHIIELRQAVDALRVVAGLGPAPWTDTVLWPLDTSIKAVHITELRSNLEAAAAQLGYSTATYTDPALSPGFVIKRVHIEELRQRIRTIAG